jgi:hypothetical protein
MVDTNYLNDFMSGFGFTIVAAICLLLLGILFYIVYRNPNTISSLFTSITNFFLDFFKNNTPLIGKDNCAIIPGTTLDVSRVPSNYLAHVVFFFAFLFTNAYYVYSMPKEPNASDEQYENRRNRTAMIMTMLVVLYISIVVIRSKVTGCESNFGITFTTLMFGALGYGAYRFAELCGARPSDVLGISTMFITEKAKKPVVCGAT